VQHQETVNLLAFTHSVDVDISVYVTGVWTIARLRQSRNREFEISCRSSEKWTYGTNLVIVLANGTFSYCSSNKHNMLL